MTYAGQERQWREEHLDWLHQQHEELKTQTQLLQRIASHTAVLYLVGILWLVGLGIGLLVVVGNFLSKL